MRPDVQLFGEFASIVAMFALAIYVQQVGWAVAATRLLGIPFPFCHQLALVYAFVDIYMIFAVIVGAVTTSYYGWIVLQHLADLYHDKQSRLAQNVNPQE